MKSKVEKALDDFVEVPEDEKEKKNKDENVKKVVLDEREGLIERVDRVFVTNDGRQLLRERY
jgi:hypothetical protein